MRIPGRGGSICAGVLSPEESIFLLCFINAVFVTVWLHEEQWGLSSSGCSEVEDFQSISRPAQRYLCAVQKPVLLQGKGRCEAAQMLCVYRVVLLYKAVTNDRANRVS